VTDLLVESVGSLERSGDHLAQDGLLLLEFGELLLEVDVFLFLRDHAEFEGAVEGLDQRRGGLGNFLINIFDFGFHCVQLLPEEFDELVVLLQVLVRLPGQVLSRVSFTSTMPRWPVACVELRPSFSGESNLLINYLYNFNSFAEIKKAA
jgi:hypothetical protein